MMKTWAYIILAATGFMAGCNQHLLPGTAPDLKETIAQQQYRFVAESASPMGGSSIPLSGGYDLSVRGDTVTAVLPYYGRATAVIDPNQGGIRFTSTKFRYAATPDGKGGWDIGIYPEDVPDLRQLQLHVTADGYARLHVTSSNRQAISFQGRVQKHNAGP